jgi:hypothetical protein
MGNTLIPTDHEPYLVHKDRQPFRHGVIFDDDDEWTRKEKELV